MEAGCTMNLVTFKDTHTESDPGEGERLVSLDRSTGLGVGLAKVTRIRVIKQQ